MGPGISIFPRFALRRPVTMAMVVAGLGVLGIIAYLRLPLELMPSGRTRATIHIRAEYRGAAPADLLEQVLEPAEESLRTLSGLDSLRTTADFERGSIRLRFHRGSDMNEAYLSVREKLERLRPKLPDDFDRFWIWRWSEGNWPILWARVIVPEQSADSLRGMLDDLEALLLRLPGVARVDIYGWADQEVAVLVNPDALRRLNVDPRQVAESLRQYNFALPLGVLQQNDRRLPVRALARLGDLQDIRELPLAPPSPPAEEQGASGEKPDDAGPGAESSILSMADVARVGMRAQPLRNYTMVDGRPAVLLAVYKEDGSNTVAVGTSIRDTLERSLPLNPRLSRLEVRELFAEDLLIRDSLVNLQWTALWGGLFALAVLWLFLRRWRATLMVILAIPISLLVNLIAMYFLGLSINLVSITGMMLALGMLVDNAVVVVENASRLRAAGHSAAEAAVQGTGEVGLAITLGTLTTIIVFLPLPFLQERAFISFLFKHISWPIALSLSASLLVAVFLVPLAARVLLEGGDLRPPAWLDWLRKWYLKALRWLLAHPLDAALVVLLVLLTVWLPASNLGWNLFGSRSQRRMRIEFRHDPVYGLPGVEKYFSALTARISPEKEALGIEYVLARYHRLGGTLSLFLRPPEERALARGGLNEALKRLIGESPGVSHRLGRKSRDSDDLTLGLKLTGLDTAALEVLARRVSQELDSTDGIGVFTFEETRAPDHLMVRVNRSAALRHGVTAAEIARRVAAALRGVGNLPRLQTGGEELDVVLQQDQEELEGLTFLTGLRMERRGGGSVPLSAVTDLLVREAPRRIVRENGETSLSLEARMEGEDLPAIEAEVRERLAAMEFPPGYTWQLGEEVKQLRQDRRSMGFSLLLGLAAIFLVMGVLFESYLLPLAVLATVPLAFFGSVWLLYLTGTSLDTTGMIGVVILVGIAVNNGIVLVDRINRNRAEGLSLDDAILTAAGDRLRPILMTALTTVSGLLPMAFGYTNVAGYSFSALGRVVVGGLLAATVLTLFVVPLAYRALVCLREDSLRLLGRTAPE